MGHHKNSKTSPDALIEGSLGGHIANDADVAQMEVKGDTQENV